MRSVLIVTILICNLPVLSQTKEIKKLEQLLEKGKYQSVIRKGEKLPSRYPQSWQVYYLLAKAYYFSQPSSATNTNLAAAVKNYMLAANRYRKRGYLFQRDSIFANLLHASVDKESERLFLTGKRSDRKLSGQYDRFVDLYFYEQAQYEMIFDLQALWQEKLSDQIYDCEAYCHLKNHDYSRIDKWVANTPPVAARRIPTLCAYLCQGAANDQEKVRAIYRWIITNIQYDYSYRIYEAEKVFAARKGICSGYSGLFNLMCYYSGIKAGVINGQVRKSALDGYRFEGHAWSAAKIGENYYLFDATWGTVFPEQYFLANPDTLLQSHLPELELHQFLPAPMSEKAFKAGLKHNSYFYQCQ